MQPSEENVASAPVILPSLPAMLAKSVPTVVRNGKVDDTLTSIRACYQVGPLTRNSLVAYKDQFKGLVSELPLTYFYLLAQRAHLAVMLDKRFPWPILGMVHVANKMEWLGVLNPQQGMQLHVEIQMPERAASRKRVRPIYIVDFIQNEHCVLRCESTYQVGTGSVKPAAGRQLRAEQLDLSHWQQLDIWDLDAASGRRYAKLSGDYNPIHLHPWLSRWFGFHHPIIHGMYSVARIQADIECHFKTSVRSMNVAFKRPLAIPNQAVSHIQPQSGKLCVTDSRGEKIYLDGLFHL
ncbi:MAG: acyl dehydratase [Idiomarina sp.]|nr:acyl dehydratase [Idiomarina sp.]